jgi:Tetratricopeptide repeat
MLAKSLLALATQAGQMVVKAAVSDQWETVQRGYAELLGRGDAKQTRLAEQRLHETREQLMGAAGMDMGLIRKALAVGWTARLADLLDEYPDAEADMRALVKQAQAALPAVTPSVLPSEKLPRPPIGTPPGSKRADSANADETIVFAIASGPAPPGTLAKQSEVAYSIGKDRDAAAARDQFAALLTAAESALGPEHPDTLATRANLAYWIGQAGDAATARDQFAALLSVAERILGPEHPDTMTNRHNLANFTGYAGDAAAARDQFAALLRIRERKFGADFPDTLVARFNLAY